MPPYKGYTEDEMAYRHKEEAYYGDDTPGYIPDPRPTPGGGGGGSGDITEIDFNVVQAIHAPWLQKKSLRNAMSKVSPNRSTNLSGANKRVEEIVSSLKECAK